MATEQIFYSEESSERLAAQMQAIHKAGMSVVYTGGCFDILHWGHAWYLKTAKRMGNVLVVHVDGDLEVKRRKGENRPVNEEAARAYVVAALGCVSVVEVSNRATYCDELMRIVKPNTFVRIVRPEQSDEYRAERVARLEEQYPGMNVVYLQPIPGVSDTALVSKINTMREAKGK